MKAKEGVINILNKILTADLTAINQYYVHAKMCENWGYERLHHKVRERSISEMKDADECIGVFHLRNTPLPHFVMEAFIAPVLAHLGMDIVLVDGRQICRENLIEYVDDTFFRFHGFLSFLKFDRDRKSTRLNSSHVSES